MDSCFVSGLAAHDEDDAYEGWSISHYPLQPSATTHSLPLLPQGSVVPILFAHPSAFPCTDQLPPVSGYGDMGQGDLGYHSLMSDHVPSYSSVPFDYYAAEFSFAGNSLNLPNTTPIPPFQSTRYPPVDLHLPTGQPEPVNSAISRKRKVAKTGNVAKKRFRHPEIDWERRKAHLKHLRCQKDHTVEEIVFEMGLIYGFHAGKSTYDKRFAAWIGLSRNNSRGNVASTDSTRHRTSQSLKDATALAESMTSKQVYFCLVDRNLIESPMHPNSRDDLTIRLDYPYKHQEAMLHGIEGLIKGFFGGSKTANWTTDTAGDFVTPANDSLTFDPWAFLSDRLACLAGLAAKATCGSAIGLLTHTILGLSINTANACGPNFMVHFWRICLTLSQVRVKNNFMQGRLVFAYVFLLRLRHVFASWLHARHAFVVIVDSLLHTLQDKNTLKDFGPSVAMGYWKSIHALQGLIGNENPVVLRMGAHCTRMCKSRFVMERELLQEKYQILLDDKKPNCTRDSGPSSSGGTEGNSIYRAKPISVSNAMALKHDCIYALWHVEIEQDFLVRMAETLRTQALDLCRGSGELRWEAASRALGFTSEVLANHHRLSMHGKDSDTQWNTKYDLFGRYMNEAIDILGKGDVDSVLQAAKLSRLLAFWLKNTSRRGNPDGCGGNNEPSNEMSHKTEVKRTERLIRKAYHAIRIASIGFPSVPRKKREPSRHARSRQKRSILMDTLLSFLRTHHNNVGR